MVFHVGGFLEDIDAAGAFVNLAALADDRLFTQGDDLRVPELNRVLMVAGGADGVVIPRIRFDSPTLDLLVRPEIRPINSQDAAAVEPDSPQAVMKMLANPWTLGIDEILQVQLNNNSAAPQDQWALLWFADAPVTPITGQSVFTARATGTTTLVANAWTSVNITMDENLPPGDYQVVGMRPESLGCVAARLIFRTGNQWRPGALGVDLADDIQDDVFRNGALGIWGEFPFTQIPAIEFLSVIADTVETIYLDLIRIRGG